MPSPGHRHHLDPVPAVFIQFQKRIRIRRHRSRRRDELCVAVTRQKRQTSDGPAVDPREVIAGHHLLPPRAHRGEHARQIPRDAVLVDFVVFVVFARL